MTETDTRPLCAIGLMSGTSLDGIDAALIVTDGQRVLEFGHALTLPYNDTMRRSIRAVINGEGHILTTERELTAHHVLAVTTLRKAAGLDPTAVDVIGFHGQTVLHRPEMGLTWQIGDGAMLARETGIDVVCDFRTADVKAGGQGAPLVPVFHAALAHNLPRPLAVLNLGGVGNITWIGTDDNGNDRLIAFDTGPGNAMIDDWALEHTGVPVDRNGALALAGRLDEDLLAILSAHAYFDRLPPKSLDRDDFSLARLGQQWDRKLRSEDGAATLTAFTAVAVAKAVRYLPTPPTRWLVCGGGRHNPMVMRALRERLDAPVDPVEAVGWDGDALEAQAFAFLAVRSLRRLPLTFPGTTGVSRPTTGGIFNRAEKDARV